MPARPTVGDQAWARTAPAVATRDLIVCGALGVCMDLWTRRTVHGLEPVRRLQGPVIFVATHGSHMDTPALLRALPAERRHQTLVLAAADYFYRSKKTAALVSLAFATVPLRRDGSGLSGETLARLDTLIAQGHSLVVFAEGTRSRDGSVGRLRSGAAVLADRHSLPLVPVALTGTHDAMPPGAKWMSHHRGRRRPIRIAFGAPIRPADDRDPRETMERVRAFFGEEGADTTPAPAEKTTSPEPAGVRSLG